MQTATAAAPAQAPQAVIEIPAPGPTRPITQAEMSVIRQQRSEMSNQLTSAQGRREELLDEIRSAPPGTEPGMMQQLQVLNDRIVLIERDIEASGRTLRTGQVPVGTTIVPPNSFGRADQAERGAAIGAMVLVPILVVYWVSRWRRRGRRREKVENSAAHDERMERLEQAVDAIAIEVERVGEAQRYQTKLLAEANLMPALNMGQRAAEPISAKEYEGRR